MFTIHHGDMLDVLAAMEPNSVDSIVCDPPYGLTFMGESWDRGVPGVEYWRAALRVLKPGGHLLAFGGPRTCHRLTCAVEDAGFEIRDVVMWLFGTGFPKSLDVSKAIDREAGAEREVVGKSPHWANRTAPNGYDGWPGHDSRDVTTPATDAAKQWEGWGTTLKPAYEPIILARKPLEGTVARNVQTYGTGAMNIDGCRVGTTVETWPKSRSYAPGQMQPGHKGETISTGDAPAGRWPANIIHDGSDEVLAGFPQSDSGSAARFFYCVKASRSERFMHLTCTCETVKLCAWVQEGRSHSAPMDSMSPEQGTCVETEVDDSFCSTSLSGNRQMDQSRKATASITSTETNKTTGSKTSISSHQLNTNDSTADVKSETDNGSNRVVFVGDCFHSLPSTTICPPKDGRFTGVVVGATSPLSSVTSKCESCGSNIKKTSHPTQKPEAMMRYLCRLVTPPEGTVLDPFMGSGSTGKAALLEGFRFVGVEREEEYVRIAAARLAAVESD